MPLRIVSLATQDEVARLVNLVREHVCAGEVAYVRAVCAIRALGTQRAAAAAPCSALKAWVRRVRDHGWVVWKVCRQRTGEHDRHTLVCMYGPRILSSMHWSMCAARTLGLSAKL